jgi:tetratricopeptide (TPR) repeat protein
MALRYCGHCGQAAEPDESFCVACGGRLRAPDIETAGDDAGSAAVSREDSIVLRHALGLLAKNDAKAALVVLQRLCDEQPEWAIARAYLGVAHLRLTNVAEARVELEEAVRLAPGSFICRTKYAEFLARLGFYDQAAAQLDEALAHGAPDLESKHAAMELRQFSRDKSKGIYYRHSSYPKLRLGRFSPARLVANARSVSTQGGK